MDEFMAAYKDGAHPNHPQGERSFLCDQCVRQHPVCAALQAEVEQHRSALVHMAALLLDAGYKGDGIPEGIEWLKARLREVERLGDALAAHAEHYGNTGSATLVRYWRAALAAAQPKEEPQRG